MNGSNEIIGIRETERSKEIREIKKTGGISRSGISLMGRGNGSGWSLKIDGSYKNDQSTAHSTEAAH